MKGCAFILFWLACAGSQDWDDTLQSELTVQIPKPEIPTLVYYAADKQWGSVYGEQGEISFNDGSNNPRLEEIPVNFQYRIECGQPSPETTELWISAYQIAKQITPTTCKQLISKSKLKLKTEYNKPVQELDFIPVPLTQTWRGAELKQATAGQDKNRLSSCCRQAECPSVCLQTPEPQKCTLEIFTVSQSLRKRFKIPCDYCPLTNCATKCSNGEYATRTTTIQDGLQVTPVECKPCPPGTWNTCKTLPSCQWIIPQAADSSLGTDIHILPGGPVGNCYNCSSVSKCWGCQVHYEGSDRKSFIDTSQSWKCPGGDSPPVNCRSTNFVMSSDGSECVCQPGMYPSGLDCIPCEPGFMCPNGTKVRCPIHYYQPASRATSCLQCGSTGDDNGFFRCDKRGYLLQFCDPTQPSSQTGELMRKCVPCNRCRRAYAANTGEGLVGCYRDD